MAKAYVWQVRLDIVQTRSHGMDCGAEPVFTHTYDVQSDHALSIIEALEILVEQERGE